MDRVEQNDITAFGPASVANVGPCYDVLGYCIDHIGDFVGATRTNAHQEVRLVEVIDHHRIRVKPAFTVNEEIAYSIGTHHYFDWELANCHFFALDTRGERGPFDKNRPDDPNTFLLGGAQRKWLIEGITASRADFIFIISPDPWVVYHTSFHMLLYKDPTLIDNPPRDAAIPKGDGFASYLAEREIILEALDKVDKPIIVITGDVHNAMSVRGTDNIWEILDEKTGCLVSLILQKGINILESKNLLKSKFGIRFSIEGYVSIPSISKLHRYFEIILIKPILLKVLS